jgi:hypothetical protein
MSAFLVSDDHITAICTFACQQSRRGYAHRFEGGERRDIKPGDHAELFRLFKQANLDSLTARYGDAVEVAEPREGRLTLTPVEIIKAIDCLEYQSCEIGMEAWEASDAGRTLASLRRAATFCLEGYDAAEWCIPPGSARYQEATATA